MKLLADLARFRPLAIALAHRELTVRYKRSIFGVLWALAEPAVLVAVYSSFFGVLFGVARGVDNYPLFALFGLLPWLFFSSSIEASTGVLLENSGLIRKVYFPRELLVASVVFSRLTTLLIGLAISTAVAAVVAAGGGDVALGRVWWFLPALVLVVAIALGATLALASLNVLLRDIGFVARFALRLGFYAVPIVYSRDLVPASVRPFYDLNPFVTITMLFQGIASSALPAPAARDVAVAVVASAACFFFGWGLFRRLGSAVADAV